MQCFLDLGNSKIKLGFMNSHNDLDVYYFDSDIEGFEKTINMIEKNKISDIYFASVNQKLTALLEKTVCNLHRIKSDDILAPCLNSELGDDIVAIIYSIKNDNINLVFSLGTANTAILFKEKLILGCSIAPGSVISIEALLKNTNLFNQEPLNFQSYELGRDTLSAINSGISLTTIGFINEVIKVTERDYKNFNVIITGGVASIINLSNITKKCIMKPNLVLHGLYNYFLRKGTSND